MREGASTSYREVIGAVFCLLFFAGVVYGLAESTAADGSNAQAVWALGETGGDVNVGLLGWGNVRQSHEAFYEKDSNGLPVGGTHAFRYDFTGDGFYTTSHETMTAGIIASRGGLAYPNDIGVAPGSNIHSARIIDNNSYVFLNYVEEALEELVLNQDCRVIVTGFQLTGIDPDGQSIWSLIYDYYACEHNVIFANAAGNVEEEITIFGDCYNGITTGGLAVTDPDVYRKVGSVSNPGPTVDGRRKPEVAGPSQDQTMPSGSSDSSWYTHTLDDGATSFSVPHTAGVAALLLGLADDTTGEPNDGRNEVLKAVMVNSAFPNIFDKAGGSTNPADPNNLWNKDRGYGRIDALRAYELLDSNQVFTDVNITEEKGWAFSTIAALQEHTYTIQAPKHYRLVATLTWNRRVEWIDESPYDRIDEDELHPYLADLDLRIYEPNDANTIFSKQDNGFDPNDNLIKCDILLTDSGEYTLKIVNNSTDETTHYGFAFELLPPLVGDIDLDYIVDYNDMRFLIEQWLEQGPGLEADLWPDGQIDMKDFCVLSEDWLVLDAAYYLDE